MSAKGARSFSENDSDYDHDVWMVFQMQIRNAREEDYGSIISVIDDWWGGRHIADMLPKLFFQHFQDTSFVVVENGQIVAFLIGFVSQTNPEQAYIHFVGVHPDYRKHGLAKELYERFFTAVRQRRCTEVHAVTSPVNKGSIAFHTRMGFGIEPGDAEVDGVQVKTDYDGRGQSRVRFVRRLVAKEGSISNFALVVVDVQNAMFNEAAPVHQSGDLLQNVHSLIAKARSNNTPVIYIQHDGGAGSDLAHGSTGWEIHPSIAPREGDVVIEKTTPDSFHGTMLDAVLRNLGVQQPVLCGIQSEVCVDTTCRRAFSQGYDVVLASDAHGTWNRGNLSAQQIIDNENDVLRWFANVRTTKEIEF